MAVVPSYSLAPVRGILQKKDTLHLLRRCLFGVGHKELAHFSGKTIEQCMDILLRPSPAPPEVVEEDYDEIDPLVPKGKTWVHAPYESTAVNYGRKLMLKMWWTGQIINRDFSLREKMTLFWHNHYVTELDVVKDSRYSYQYIALLRAHALGNVKKLITDGTTTPAMLVYQNGNSSTKEAPNENYGRELMELFTLGKGHGVNYTEGDVKAAARVLTGWKDDKDAIKGVFYPDLHDDTDKKFSVYFDNKVISGRKGADGANEIGDLIELIFSRKEAARYICRNLYRWFVYSKIDEEVEARIITPLADIYRQSNCEIIPVLKTLLSSEHFFDAVFRGCLVKSPVDFLVGAAQQVNVKVYDTKANVYTDLVRCHEPWLQFHLYLEDLSQRIGDPPSVAGWAAYYQEPKFHQWWINSASLSLRSKILGGLSTHEGLVFNGPRVSFDFISFVSGFADPATVDAFTDDCTDLMLAVPISTRSKDKLKATLRSNMQSDRDWKKAWQSLRKDPENMEARSVLETRLTQFFREVMNLTEYQMM